MNYASLKDWIMEVQSDPNKCRKHCYGYLEARYQDLKDHINSNKRIATMSARNITPLAKILDIQRAVQHKMLED